MSLFENIVKRLARYMYYIAGLSIVAMMLLTCVDVGLRFAVTLYAKFGWQVLFHLKPIPGTYELVCFLGSVAAAFAMAHTSVEAGHVSVNFLTRLLPDKIQAGFQIGTCVLGLFLFSIISWQSFIYAQKLKEWGEVSMTLMMPFYPFVFGVSFSAFAVCLVLIAAIISEGRKVLER